MTDNLEVQNRKSKMRWIRPRVLASGQTDSMKTGTSLKAQRNSEKVFIVVSVCAAVFVLCVSAQAQLKGKPKIGVLTPAERQWEGAAFREGLHNLGHIDGSNIVIDVRSAEGKLERMPELAAALIHSDVDIIVSVNTPSTRAAMEQQRRFRLS